MGGGNHPNIDFNQLAATNAKELALGQHAQQTSLQRQGHVADFIQKQSAAVGLLEATGVASLGSGERAGLVTKQLGLEQLGRNRGGVQGHEGLCCAR